MRAVELSIGAFCTEFRCEQLCDGDIFFESGSNLGLFTKRDAVRAVERSIGEFCTEFRCEQLCDDDNFWIGVEIWMFAPPPAAINLNCPQLSLIGLKCFVR